jgi:tRNA A-37 threonylcarbamoyl transferase component Bud32
VTYRVVGVLGRGGMSVVELAEDADGRPVARKRIHMHGSAAQVDQAQRRLRREAELLRRLDHPGIVRLLEVEDEGTDVVLVMPFLPGGTLADRVAATGPLPAPQVEYLLDALLDALAAAHRGGVVHRDIKPDNILFDASGRPALADFGVATARDLTAGLTATGALVGTPTFMAPEQARGEPASAASDVFALGATMLFALTGAAPYGDGDPVAVLWRAGRARGVPVPPTVPPALRRRLAAMLDRRPARRPSAASARGGTAGTGVLRLMRRRSMHRSRRTAGALLVGALLVGALLMGIVATGGAHRWLTSRHPTEAAQPSRPDPAPCTPLPYQPCGGPPAPFTDGQTCLASHADYDANPANGCEAAPDTLADGSLLARRVDANLVPAGDIDTFAMQVDDRFQLFCDGLLRVTLTSPSGTAQRLDVIDPTGRVLASATSSDGGRAVASVQEPSCGGDDSGRLAARVTTVRGLSAQPYRLERSGSF